MDRVDADYSRLQEVFGDRLRRQVSLARYTAARLGGPADALLIARDMADLTAAVRIAWEGRLPYRVLGGGANVLVADAGFRGLVIVNRADGVTFHEDGLIEAESGASLVALVRRCITRGLAGLEWAVSIPGTVGGAAINNAGAHGGDMAAVVRKVTALTPPGFVDYTGEEMAYGYRASRLKGSRDPYLVTAVTMQMAPGADPARLASQADVYVAHRKRTQPPGASLGSIFRNPPGDYAGRLIEAAGLKGASRGAVQISPVHANFFVNTGDGGAAADYLALIRLAQEEVRTQFGIWLEPEIELIGFDPAASGENSETV